MKEFEALLKDAIENKNGFNSVNCLPIEFKDRMLIDKLKNTGLIENVRYAAAVYLRRKICTNNIRTENMPANILYLIANGAESESLANG